LATGTLAINRFSLAVFTAVALVFSVQGVNAGIYGSSFASSAAKALGVGWLFLSFINVSAAGPPDRDPDLCRQIFWLFVFSADENNSLFGNIVYFGSDHFM
jgi:hypothetical protein